MKALQLTGQFKSVLNTIKSKTKPIDYHEKLTESQRHLKTCELFEVDRNLSEFAREESESFFL